MQEVQKVQCRALPHHITLTIGFCERLVQEVQCRAPRYQIGVHAAGGAHQIAVPWIGGSMIACSPSGVCVSRIGYEEYGNSIIREALDWTAS